MKAWLDFARLLMALIVVADHTVILLFLPPNLWQSHDWFPWLNLWAAVAVCTFMMISGYAIAHSVTPHHSSFSLRRFAAHRMARIYPPLLVAIAMAVVLAICLPKEFTTGFSANTESDGLDYFLALGTQAPLWQSILTTLFFAHDPIILNKDAWLLIAAAWTLPFEIIMYVTAGISFRLFHTNQQFLGAGGIAIWIALWLFILWSGSSVAFIFFGLWVLGFTIGLIKQQYRIVGITLSLLLCALISLYAYSVWTPPISSALSQPLTAPHPYTEQGWMISVGSATLSFGVFLSLGVFSDLMGNFFQLSPKIKITDFSYSLYICHFPLLLALGVVIELAPLFAAVPIELILLIAMPTLVVMCWIISLVAERKHWFAYPLLRLMRVQNIKEKCSKK